MTLLAAIQTHGAPQTRPDTIHSVSPAPLLYCRTRYRAERRCGLCCSARPVVPAPPMHSHWQSPPVRSVQAPCATEGLAHSTHCSPRADMMVRFELARPRATSDAEPKSKPKQHLVLEPSRVLHPRFDPAVAGQGGQTTGKGMWVTCWSDAVAALAKKGDLARPLPERFSKLTPECRLGQDPTSVCTPSRPWPTPLSSALKFARN